MDQSLQLERWRHLIEPETGGGITPVSWDDVLSMPVIVVEGKKSVLVLRDCVIGGRLSRSIWVAAGELDEVLDLMGKAESKAKDDGIKDMVYVGRRGWMRAAGYQELAVIGRKGL